MSTSLPASLTFDTPVGNNQTARQGAQQTGQPMDFQDLPLFRVDDPETSKQGAADVAIRQGSQCWALLASYDRHRLNGLTAEEAGKVTEWKGHTMHGLRVCYWKRVSDLLNKGLIEDAGTTRQSDSGSMQRVNRITAEGVRLLRA